MEEKECLVTITINRPDKLNALCEGLFIELKDLLKGLKSSGKIRGMIFTGAGQKAFAAGADIKQMSQMNASEGEAFSALAQEVTELFESLPFPVIACVDGFALGGGCEMAMAADFIFATERSTFGQPEVNLGLIPGFGGCVRLQKLVGPALAKEMIYTGRFLDGKEAQAAGLVLSTFSQKEKMLSEAINTLKKIAEKSPVAVTICKKVMDECQSLSTHEALKVERKGFHQAFLSEDKKEGVAAFLEKRPARF